MKPNCDFHAPVLSEMCIYNVYVTLNKHTYIGLRVTVVISIAVAFGNNYI